MLGGYHKYVWVSPGSSFEHHYLNLLGYPLWVIPRLKIWPPALTCVRTGSKKRIENILRLRWGKTHYVPFLQVLKVWGKTHYHFCKFSRYGCTFNAQGLRLIIVAITGRAGKVYVVGVEAFRRKERQDETQFTTEIMIF